MAENLVIERSLNRLRIFLDDYEVTNVISYNLEEHPFEVPKLTLVLAISETMRIKIKAPT